MANVAVNTDGIEILADCENSLPGSILLPTVSFFERCSDISLEDIILQIAPSQMTAQGFTVDITPTYTPVVTNASTAPVGNLYASRAYNATFTSQEDAGTAAVDELLHSSKYVESSNPAWWVQRIGDDTGTRVVLVSMLVETYSGVDLLYRDWVPNAEVMAGPATAQTPGQPYGRAFSVMGMPDKTGARAFRYRAASQFA
jgi:hypothetical protein